MGAKLLYIVLFTDVALLLLSSFVEIGVRGT
jgi:hypothetical protein